MTKIIEIEVGELIDEIRVRELRADGGFGLRSRVAIKLAAIESIEIDRGGGWVEIRTATALYSARCRVDAGYTPNAARDAEFAAAAEAWIEGWRDHG